MTDLKEAPAVHRQSIGQLAAWATASAVVVLVGAYFLQHFPAFLLALALAFIAIGRLAPIVQEATSRRTGSIFRACFDFAGVGLLALAAMHGALGEITGAWVALMRG